MTVVSSATYEPFGPLSGAAYGNGVVAALSYDQDYQLTAITSAAGATSVQNLTYGYDPSGNITSIADHLTAARSQTLGYDDLNRLASASGLYGPQSYTYDGVGNRKTRVAGGVSETYDYASDSNQLQSIGNGTSVRSFAYLPSGQMSEDLRDADDAYEFSYGDDGRLSLPILNGAAVAADYYDADGQRAAKITGANPAPAPFTRAKGSCRSCAGAAG